MTRSIWRTGMTMNDDKDLEEAVRGRLGEAEDNLCRAKLAARNRDADAQWGESGETLQQVIDGYQAAVDHWKAALSRLKEE